MLVKTILDEDFSNYKKPCMLIGTCFCNWKCCLESNLPITICQNQPLSKEPNIDISIKEICKRYFSNVITQAICFGGLEPFLQFSELFEFVSYFRKYSQDDIIIYTGYNKEEIINEIDKLKKYNNIIIKFGRFKIDSKPKYDEILGITLASSNQYAEKIS